MQKHHHHYMINTQLCLLAVLGVGVVVSSGWLKLSTLVAYLSVASLMYVLIKLLASISRQLMPDFTLSGHSQIHGSLLPTVVISPNSV